MPIATQTRYGAEAFETLLTPRSIAVVGASANTGKLAGRVLPNLLSHGYKGRIYPVNPATERIGDIETFADLRELPEVPDTVVSLVPADRTLPVIQSAVELGVPTATIVASGLGEGSGESQRLGGELRSMLETGSLRVLGPNSIGAIDVSTGCVQRATVNLPSRLTHGPVGVLSHSGAMSLILLHLLHIRGLGCDRVVPLGNEIDLTVSDALLNLVERDVCRCVIVFIESIRDPTGFAHAMEVAREGGLEIIALSAGASQRGRDLIAGHTGALATDRRLQGALLRELGVISVGSPRQAVDAAALCLRRGRAQPTPGKLGLICISGGEAALLADRVDELGIALAEPGGVFNSRFSKATNPLDLTADALTDPKMIESAYAAFATSPEVDCIGFVMSPLADRDRHLVHGAIDGLRRRDQRVFLIAWPAMTSDDGSLSADFVDSDDFLHAYSAAARAATFARPGELAVEVKEAGLTANWVGDRALREMLHRSGTKLCPEEFVSSIEEAELACKSLSPPWVLKGSVKAGAHKANMGMVSVDLRSVNDVLTEFDRMRKEAQRQSYSFDGAWLQEMMAGVELFLGGLRGDMGEFIGIGLGGSLVEQSSDIAFVCAPVSEAAVRRLLNDPVASPLPSILRANQPLVDAICKSTGDLQGLFADPTVQLAEINPLIVTRDGEPVAVDARILSGGRK